MELSLDCRQLVAQVLQIRVDAEIRTSPRPSCLVMIGLCLRNTLSGVLQVLYRRLNVLLQCLAALQDLVYLLDAILQMCESAVYRRGGR